MDYTKKLILKILEIERFVSARQKTGSLIPQDDTTG